MNFVLCCMCGKKVHETCAVFGGALSPCSAKVVLNSNMNYSSEQWFCLDDINILRANYVQRLLEEERGQLSFQERRVIKSLKEGDFLASNINKKVDSDLTFAERSADFLADFGGSWTFISWFLFFIFLWVGLNSLFASNSIFDPYPYILLNLLLSFLSTLQAPVIMMSQKRQEARDRIRANHDYEINLKSEFEIQLLLEQIDNFMSNQWQRLLEIQQIQTELLTEFSGKMPKKKSGKKK